MQKIFDAHFHIIDHKFPLFENQGYLPTEFTIASYKAATEKLNISGGAIVSGSFQGFDQSYLIHALSVLGPDFVGVTQLPVSVSEKEIIQLNANGVRAIRFNLKRGESSQIKDLKFLSDKVYALASWHAELYVDGKDLESLMPLLLTLKKFSIDHLGLSKEGLPILKKLVEQGAIVKASGFGRLNFEPLPVIKELNSINPRCILFGTDLPSTRAQKPFSIADVNLFTDNFDTKTIENLLFYNAKEFYTA